MDIKQIQQGDVWIESAVIPSDAQEVKQNGHAVFAEGEGHHVHRAASVGAVTMYLKGGIKYARVHQDTAVEHVTLSGHHGEHNPVTLPAGDYRFGQVQEYDYLAEMARSVID